jgi:hypothetical protein
MYSLYLNSELKRHDAHRATNIKTPDTTNNTQHTPSATSNGNKYSEAFVIAHLSGATSRKSNDWFGKNRLFDIKQFLGEGGLVVRRVNASECVIPLCLFYELLGSIDFLFYHSIYKKKTRSCNNSKTKLLWKLTK